MRRVLIVPAAGRGSRLGSELPKMLVPVNGKPMLQHILERYAGLMDRFVVVISPAFRDALRQFTRDRPEAVVTALQPEPTGMLDAILAAGEALPDSLPDEVWITWCDQVAVGPETVRRLARASGATPAPALTFPTIQAPDPYIHFTRDERGTISGVLQRREGDRMPPMGEADMGLFALQGATYHELLPAFAVGAGIGGATGERNFLPFIPWLSRRGLVATFGVEDRREAVGINTPAELERVATYLRTRGGP